jgi:hypothetical protein
MVEDSIGVGRMVDKVVGTVADSMVEVPVAFVVDNLGFVEEASSEPLVTIDNLGFVDSIKFENCLRADIKRAIGYQ